MPAMAAASAHIALAAMPVQVVDNNGDHTMSAVQPVMQAALLHSAFDTPSPQTGPQPAAPRFAPVDDARADANARQIECMAKVIVHEAGNQPRRGQLAVAQVIRTRMKDGRFGNDACSVVQQRGQFFDVDAYTPSRTDSRWAMAVEIAVETLNGTGEEVVPGALYFHSAGAAMQGRVRIAQVADHVFYR